MPSAALIWAAASLAPELMTLPKNEPCPVIASNMPAEIVTPEPPALPPGPKIAVRPFTDSASTLPTAAEPPPLPLELVPELHAATTPRPPMSAAPRRKLRREKPPKVSPDSAPEFDGSRRSFISHCSLWYLAFRDFQWGREGTESMERKQGTKAGN